MIEYAYGDTKPIQVPILSTQVVAVGDLVGQAAGTLVRASDFVWGAVIAAPAAPTVTDSGVAVGSALTHAVTGVKVSYNTAEGEGALSAAGTATPTAGAALDVAAIALPAGVTGVNYYVETAAGSGIYKLARSSSSGEAQQLAAYGNGRVPPTASPTGALQATQAAFAAAFLGVSGQMKGLTTFFSNPATMPYGNSLPVCRVATAGTFWADVAAASFNVGDLLGPDKDTGNVLLNQQLVAVGSAALAVAECVEAAANATRVKVRLRNPSFND